MCLSAHTAKMISNARIRKDFILKYAVYCCVWLQIIFGKGLLGLNNKLHFLPLLVGSYIGNKRDISNLPEAGGGGEGVLPSQC